MLYRKFTSLGGLFLAAIVSLALVNARHNNTVAKVDFGATVRATSPVYDAAVAPASDAGIKAFRIPI
jgi:hypothetical protein